MPGAISGMPSSADFQNSTGHRQPKHGLRDHPVERERPGTDRAARVAAPTDPVVTAEGTVFEDAVPKEGGLFTTQLSIIAQAL